jgi:octaprenyl-diphosphate synthase
MMRSITPQVNCRNGFILTVSPSWLAPDMARMESILLASTAGRFELLHELIQGLMEAGGKRLRPMLTILSARLCGYQGEAHSGLAAVVECIHAATLLHDDVIDDSHLRRGRPTANDVWGNKTSILAGDFLLSQAFFYAVTYGSKDTLLALAEASSVIAEGEIIQLSHLRDLQMSEATYQQIIHAKTAILFAVACRIGGHIAGAEPVVCEQLAAFGNHYGFAFQMIDDILDYMAGDGVDGLGKEPGDDVREGKVTLPVILAYAKASTEEKQRLERIFVHQEVAAENFEFVVGLLKQYGIVAEITRRIEARVSAALSILATFPGGEVANYLSHLLQQAGGRCS